jgi:hypothetical protein
LYKLLKSLLTVVFWAFAFANPAHAQVQWEDFQGNSRVTGTSGQDYPGPNYPNGTGTSATRLAALRAIAATPSNAVRSGTSQDINFVASSLTLCDLDSDPAGTSAACRRDAQGRVMYAVLKLPYAGNYSFSIAHDDDIDLDFSTAYANTDYRNGSYDVAIGVAQEYTSSDTVYETLTGTVNAPTANSCVLVRLYWNNVGGRNFLRLRWTRPLTNSSSSTVTEIIPSAQYMLPGTTSGCGGSVTTVGRTLTLNKVVAASGRADPTDQFTVSIANSSAAVLKTATTSGSGTGQQASTGAYFVTAGTTYQLIDTMASGSRFGLNAYSGTLACTVNGTTLSATATGTTGVWTITVPSSGATTQSIICNITNTRASRQLRIDKTWVGAVVNNAVRIPPTTGFSTNTAQLNSVASAANETDQGTVITVLTGTGTLPAEVFTVGNASMYGSSLSCTDGTVSGTDGQQSNTLAIGAAGTLIVCTYTNSYRPPMTLTKTSAAYWDPLNLTNNPKMIPGGLVTYTVTGTIPSSYTVTSGTIAIVDHLPARARLVVSDIGAAASGPVAFAPGISGLTYSFGGLASTSDDVDFSNDGGLSWSYIPTPGPNGVDSNVTSIRVMPKGAMAAGSTFSLNFRVQI